MILIDPIHHQNPVLCGGPNQGYRPCLNYFIYNTSPIRKYTLSHYWIELIDKSLKIRHKYCTTYPPIFAANAKRITLEKVVGKIGWLSINYSPQEALLVHTYGSLSLYVTDLRA